MKMCKIISNNVCNYRVGDIVELTENQVRAFANKIEVLEDAPKPQAKTKAKAKAESGLWGEQ